MMWLAITLTLLCFTLSHILPPTVIINIGFDAPCSFPGTGDGEGSSVDEVKKILLSTLHFQFPFTLGLDEYISK